MAGLVCFKWADPLFPWLPFHLPALQLSFLRSLHGSRPPRRRCDAACPDRDWVAPQSENSFGRGLCAGGTRAFGSCTDGNARRDLDWHGLDFWECSKGVRARCRRVPTAHLWFIGHVAACEDRSPRSRATSENGTGDFGPSIWSVCTAARSRGLDRRLLDHRLIPIPRRCRCRRAAVSKLGSWVYSGLSRGDLLAGVVRALCDHVHGACGTLECCDDGCGRWVCDRRRCAWLLGYYCGRFCRRGRLASGVVPATWRGLRQDGVGGLHAAPVPADYWRCESTATVYGRQGSIDCQACGVGGLCGVVDY